MLKDNNNKSSNSFEFKGLLSVLYKKFVRKLKPEKFDYLGNQDLSSWGQKAL